MEIANFIALTVGWIALTLGTFSALLILWQFVLLWAFSKAMGGR